MPTIELKEWMTPVLRVRICSGRSSNDPSGRMPWDGMWQSWPKTTAIAMSATTQDELLPTVPKPTPT
ncbi:unnamed protein product [Symbiodinium necroappetens]|uniref:Uncharacterized protein n=1 Tax=Symbiodinium necroappetens TaxID=1628268 RepID=A0A813AKH9_9DINO|nr:unnamed protein product [Symbiodinium necroappetens]